MKSVKIYMLVALVVALLANSMVFYSRAKSSQENCQSIESVKGLLRQIVHDDIKFRSNLQYFKDHPDELENYLKSTTETLKKLEESECELEIFPWQ